MRGRAHGLRAHNNLRSLYNFTMRSPTMPPLKHYVVSEEPLLTTWLYESRVHNKSHLHRNAARVLLPLSARRMCTARVTAHHSELPPQPASSRNCKPDARAHSPEPCCTVLDVLKPTVH